MLDYLKTLKAKVKMFVKRTPWIYRIVVIWRGHSDQLCNRQTDLSLEGFPSSANTFTWNLLRELNDELKIAHRTHSVASIKLALRYGIPIVVLVRNPEDAVSSVMARYGFEPNEGLMIYTDLYKFAVENADKLLILPFEEITQDTERSIRKISEATGIELDYVDLETVKSQVLAEMERWYKKHENELRDGIPLPGARKKMNREKLKEKVRASNYYEEAMSVWRNLVSGTS